MNDCSGHGVCSTIGELAIYKGPDYNTLTEVRGDGFGNPYTFWDKDSTSLCNCDYGYFGADCSQGN